MELREIFDFGKLGVITERAKLPKYALAKLSYTFARADVKNANYRTYSESILSREVGRKSEELRTQKIPGMLEHPLSGITKLDGIAHVLTDVSYDRTTKLASAESFVLNTSKGRDFMVMLDAELSMGCSMRGWGNVKNNYVQSDWKFDTLDFVLHPSFQSDAMIDKSNIIESANNIFDEKGNKGGNMKDKMMGLTENYVNELMQSVYEIYIKEGNFEGSFAEFEKENGNAVRAGILVEEGKCRDIEKALKYLGAKEEIKKIPTAPIKKVTPAEIYLEATMSGVDPAVYAEKMNANLAKSDPILSTGEISSILAEARQAGFDTSDEQEKKRLLDAIRKQKTQKVITEDEKAEIVARRTGSTVEFVKEIWAKEKSKKEKEQKKLAHYRFINSERAMSGFGQEMRPEARKISQKILDKE